MLLDSRLHLVQMDAGGPQAFSGDGEGDEIDFVFIVAAGIQQILQIILQLRGQPFGSALLGLERDLVFGIHGVGLQGDVIELVMHRWIAEVDKIAPAVQDIHLFVVVQQLIVDVVILDRLGIMGIVQLTDAVPVHPQIWDRLLRRMGAVFIPVHLGDQGVQLLLLRPRQLDLLLLRTFGFSFLSEQWRSPPC